MSPYDFLQRTLVSEFNVPADRIKPDATLASLGLDSLSLAELMLEIETEYGIVLAEEDMREGTLGEAASLVDARVRESRP